TSEILALHFRPAEEVPCYPTLFQQLFTTHGLPLALYGDRLNLLVRNDPHWSIAEELAGTQHPTHLGRMLQDLGIGYVAAHSPQAKGRIERLWATLQDRLVSELRLRGLTTVPAATAYLPEFIADLNHPFGKPPPTPRSSPTTAAFACANSRQGGHFHVAVRPDIFIDQRQWSGGFCAGATLRRGRSPRADHRACGHGRLLRLRRGAVQL